jgi:hypothetical protein
VEQKEHSVEPALLKLPVPQSLQVSMPSARYFPPEQGWHSVYGNADVKPAAHLSQTLWPDTEAAVET